MKVLPNLLWHAVGALNAYSSFKALKPPSRARKGIPARGIRERKRDVELQVALYIVWTAFQQVETLTDRTVYFVLPFYDEIKLGLLLWMLASRTVGSDLVYRHLLRPVLAMYDRPLELIFSLIFLLTEVVIAVAIRPTLHGLSSSLRRLRARWSGPRLKEGSTAALLAASKNEVRMEEDRAREVVKEAREVYGEISRLQQAPRPLSRTGSSGGRVRKAAVQETTAIAEAKFKTLNSKPTVSHPLPVPRRATSVQPSNRPTSGASSPRPSAGKGARRPSGTEPQLIQKTSAVKRIIRPRSGRPAQELPPKPLTAQIRSLPAISPPQPATITFDTFLLPPEGSQPLPTDRSSAQMPSSSWRAETPFMQADDDAPLFTRPDAEAALSLYPSLPCAPVEGGFGISSDESADAVVGDDQGTAAAPLSSKQEAPASVMLVDPVVPESTLSDSPARLAFEAQRAPALPPTGTPVPPGSFLRPPSAPGRSATSSSTAADVPGRPSSPKSPSQDLSAGSSRLSTPPSVAGPSKSTPMQKRTRLPPTPETRATPARRAKQTHLPLTSAPPAAPLASPDGRSTSGDGGSSGKRRKVSERWEYVPVLEVETLDELDLAEGKKRVRRDKVVVNLNAETDDETEDIVDGGPSTSAAGARGAAATRGSTLPKALRQTAAATSASTRSNRKVMSSVDGKGTIAPSSVAAQARKARPTRATTSATSSAAATARPTATRAMRTAASAAPQSGPTEQFAASLRTAAPVRAKASALAGGPVRVRRGAQTSEAAREGSWSGGNPKDAGG